MLIGGVDVAQLERRHLRTRLLTVVPQEPALFAGSLRDNLAIGRPDASEEELWAAAEAAVVPTCGGAVGATSASAARSSRAGRSSASIARALVRDTPIVVLDEASSALDARLEGEVLRSLDAALRGKVVVIAPPRRASLIDRASATVGSRQALEVVEVVSTMSATIACHVRWTFLGFEHVLVHRHLVFFNIN